MHENRLEHRGASDRLLETREGLRASLRRWRWSRKPPWAGFGEPFNGQQFRRQAVDLLIDRFDPDSLIETGTFMCFTTRYLADKGIDTYTVEVDPGYGRLAAKTLRDLSNVTLIHGDSAAAIEKLAAGGRLRRPLVYLDAHWEERLPLREEVESLFSHWEDFVVVVDDFKVPHMPGYGYDVYNGAALSLDEIVLPDDAIIAYPATPPEQETGSRRGAIYLGRGNAAALALNAAAEAGLVALQTPAL